MSDSKQIFLIRSSNEVLGPYNKEEIINLIKKGKISIFDEVTEPYKIWSYLENHKEFEKTVRSMNIQTRLTNFLTHISHRISISRTSSKASDKTQTLTERSQTIPNQNKEHYSDVSFNLVPEKTETYIKSSLKIKKKILSTEEKEKQAQKKLLKEQEEKKRKQIGFLVKLSWKLIILAGFSIIGLIIYNLSYLPIKEKNTLLEELNNQGKNYYKQGDFKKALPFFEKVQTHLTQKEKFTLSILLLQNDKLAEAILTKKEITNQKILKKDTWTLLEGLIHFYSRNYSKANKSFSDVILKNNNQTKSIAQLNLILSKLENQQYNELRNEITELSKVSFNRGILWYLRGLYLLKKKQFLELENYLTTHLNLENKKTWIIEYKQELLFLLAYSYMKNEKPELVEATLKKSLNQDPYFVEEYQYDALIAKNKLNWNILYPYCKETYNSHPESSMIQAFYGFCLIKINQLQKAKTYIKKANNQEADNSLFLSLQAYLLMAQNQNTQKIDQVFSLINNDSQSSKENNLTLILKAHHLEKNRYWNSALGIWKDLNKRDINNLSALAGISYNSYNTEDKVTGDFYRKKVLNIYPHYIKILPF